MILLHLPILALPRSSGSILPMELKGSLEVSTQPIKYHTTLSTRSLRVTIGSSTEPTLLSSPQEAPAPKLTKVVAGVALAQALGQA